MAFKTRPLLFAFLSLSLICLALSRNTKQVKTLLIYTPHSQDLLKDFASRYKQSHPDVDVQFLDMGARDILERLRAERNRPQADIWWGASHTTFQTAAEENLLAVYRPSWADKIPESERDAHSRCY